MGAYGPFLTGAGWRAVFGVTLHASDPNAQRRLGEPPAGPLDEHSAAAWLLGLEFFDRPAKKKWWPCADSSLSRHPSRWWAAECWLDASTRLQPAGYALRWKTRRRHQPSIANSRDSVGPGGWCRGPQGFCRRARGRLRICALLRAGVEVRLGCLVGLGPENAAAVPA